MNVEIYHKPPQTYVPVGGIITNDCKEEPCLFRCVEFTPDDAATDFYGMEACDCCDLLRDWTLYCSHFSCRCNKRADGKQVVFKRIGEEDAKALLQSKD